MLRKDRSTLQLVCEEQHYDEIGKFQDALYVSATEAFLRLFSYEIINKLPPVVPRDVNLKDHLKFILGQTAVKQHLTL